MNIIYLLIAVSLVLVAAIVYGLMWAFKHGQFDDLERHAYDVLLDDDPPLLKASRADEPDAPRDPDG